MKKFYLVFAIFFIGVFYVYAQDSWARRADFTGISTYFGRYHGTGFSIGMAGYMGTGNDPSHLYMKDFWKYDQSSDTWSQIADFGGSPTDNAFGFSIGTKGYVGGGCCSGGFYEYNPSTNIWTAKANNPVLNGYASASFAIGSKGYVISADSSHLWEYNPSSDTWTKKANYPGAGGSMDYLAAFAIGTKGYAGCGGDGTINSGDFWQWDQSTNTWTRMADFPTANTTGYITASFAIGSKGYITVPALGNYSILQEYYPATNTWSSRANLSSGIAGAAGFSIGNYGYIGTGSCWDSTLTKAYWQYTPILLLSAINGSFITSSLCGGSPISVDFYADGYSNTGNIFTAQLSNATGSFASAVTIGTSNDSTYGWHTINAIIPANTASGNGYRIRVISSNPVIIGSDNGSNITITPAPLLNLKFFTQGYYINGGTLKKVLHNEAVDTNALSTNVDTVVVELHNTTSPYAVAESYKGMLQTNGTLVCYYSCNVSGHSYYIAVKHRNTIQTWSAAPVAFTASTSYDFTTAAAKAYGNNMIQMQAGKWAFFTGDINQDENIDLQDFPALDYGIVNGLFGYYAGDLNGDGNVDLVDFPLLNANIILGIFSQHP